MMAFGRRDEEAKAAAAEEKAKREAAARAQREAAAAEKAERQERERAAKELKRFLATPQGMARTAFEQGSHVFQVSFDVRSTKANVVPMGGAFTTSTSNDVTAVLNEICCEGWDLLTASMVFLETGSESRDKFMASGQQIAVKGDVIGYYVFKRSEGNRVPTATG
jgi:hypothetical protein